MCMYVFRERVERRRASFMEGCKTWLFYIFLLKGHVILFLGVQNDNTKYPKYEIIRSR